MTWDLHALLWIGGKELEAGLASPHANAITLSFPNPMDNTPSMLCQPFR